MTPTMTQHGRAELATSVWGSDGPPIVALHPGVGDSRVWGWCAPVWADAGHRVVAYDRRGFGETQFEPETYDDLSDLQAVTAATNARPSVIVGNSRGGGLALDLALAQPGEVLGLVLIAPSPSGYPYDDWPTADAEARLDALIEQAEASGDLEGLNRLEVRYWLDGVDQPEGRVQGAARDLMIDMNGRALRATSPGDAAVRRPVWPSLERILTPTLVIDGDYDLPGYHQLCDRLADALPTAERATISRAAHCPSLDQPDALNALVLDFVGSLAL